MSSRLKKQNNEDICAMVDPISRGLKLHGCFHEVIGSEDDMLMHPSFDGDVLQS